MRSTKKIRDWLREKRSKEAADAADPPSNSSNQHPTPAQDHPSLLTEQNIMPNSPVCTMTGSFTSLPFEIRQRIYTSILVGQIIHVCPDEMGTYHHTGSTNEAINYPPPEVPGKPSKPLLQRFHNSLIRCSSNAYETIHRDGGICPVKWSHAAFAPLSYLPPVSSILHFFLTCKLVYHEMEPLLWTHASFAFGVPQFVAFHERFLVPARPHHSVATPRAQLLRSVQIALPSEATLKDDMGRDYGRYPSEYDVIRLVDEAMLEGYARLTGQCPGLRELVAVVLGENLNSELGVGGLPINVWKEGHNLLRFKGLEAFGLALGWNTSKQLSRTHPGAIRLRQALAATESALATILKRTAAEDAVYDFKTPPDGWDSAGEDYYWLKKEYERKHGGDPRLSELILRTQGILERQGIEVPSVALVEGQ